MARSIFATAGIVGTTCLCTAIIAAVSRAARAAGFRLPHGSSSTLPRRSPSSSSSSSSSLRAFGWPTLPPPLDGLLPKWPGRIPPAVTMEERNGLDPEYPWAFGGRFVFRPSLVRVVVDYDDDSASSSSPSGRRRRRPPSAELLSLFGYSLGGSVILEYDYSPVGPYREYVTMGGVVGLGRVDVPGESSSSLCLGQWGTDLYVSTAVAEDVCRRAWGVPAQVANIEFEEDGEDLVDGPGDDDDDDDDDDEGGGGGRMRKFVLSGWGNARILGDGDGEGDVARNARRRYGNVPIFWTPTIKALWAPILLPLGGKRGGGEDETTSGGREEGPLPLHKLRLSASALGLRRCRRMRSAGEVPLGFALVVDNVLIEIGERIAPGSS